MFLRRHRLPLRAIDTHVVFITCMNARYCCRCLLTLVTLALFGKSWLTLRLLVVRNVHGMAEFIILVFDIVQCIWLVGYGL